jgi:type IV secretion system protein VirB9
VAVPLTEFRTPDNTPEASPQPQTPQQVEQLVLQNNQLFEIRPEQDDYRGGDVEYNWVPNHIYELFVAPLELSTIVLEPGESVVNAPAAGDTANFMVATTYHIEKEQKIEEVLVKPIYAGKKTTLLINTDKRTYTFRVISYEALFMPLISFNYPLELAEKMKEDAASKENRILMFGRITDLDFAYQIIPHTIHKPAWCPDRVFTDGRKTYFSFPSASRASFAPVLFEVNSRNERVLLNYRVVGSYFIADHRIEHCELVLDVNEGNIIDIVHKED